MHGKLLPRDADNADNAGIVDLANAPTNADGYVNYTTDVVILRPKSAANSRRVLFYDVVNRGIQRERGHNAPASSGTGAGVGVTSAPGGSGKV